MIIIRLKYVQFRNLEYKPPCVHPQVNHTKHKSTLSNRPLDSTFNARESLGAWRRQSALDVSRDRRWNSSTSTRRRPSVQPGITRGRQRLCEFEWMKLRTRHLRPRVDASAGTYEQTQTLDFINVDEITWSGVLVDHMQLIHKIQINTK